MLATRNGSIHLRFENGAVRVIPHEWRRVYAPPVTQTHPWLPAEVRSSREYCDVLSPIIRVKRIASAGNQLASDGRRREATTLVVDPKPQGYYRVFCAHDKAYWSTCGHCRRDKREATENWIKLTSTLTQCE